MTQGQDGEILSRASTLGGFEPELNPTGRLGTFHNLSFCESQRTLPKLSVSAVAAIDRASVEISSSG